MLVLVIVREYRTGGWVAKPRLVAVPSQDVPDNRIVERTVYRCMVNGKLVYVGAKPCDLQAPSFDTPAPPAAFAPPQATALVPAPGLTDYQREMLRSADARIARDEANARTNMMAMRRRAAGTRDSVSCAALEREIDSLDAWARQPMSGAQQDQIRSRRAHVRSKQSELRC